MGSICMCGPCLCICVAQLEVSIPHGECFLALGFELHPTRVLLIALAVNAILPRTQVLDRYVYNHLSKLVKTSIVQY